MIWSIILSAVAFALSAYFLKGVEVKSPFSAILVAIIMAVLSATVGAILNFFSFPLNFITLGAFSFVIDAILILIAAKLLDGFFVRDFWAALSLAVVLSLVNWGIHYIF